MIKFDELPNRSMFSVYIWEIKTNNVEFLNKYAIYSHGKKKSLTFVKTGDFTCEDTVTQTEFEMDGIRMINEQLGLSFIANFVNNSNFKNSMKKEEVIEYFEYAKDLANQKTKTLKK